jgi:hypothetical protein
MRHGLVSGYFKGLLCTVLVGATSGLAQETSDRGAIPESRPAAEPPESGTRVGGNGPDAADQDVRTLLMKALDVPQDAPFKVRGWIQNRFTGNANGFGNGLNFGVNPNFKANQWMGNQYYVIFEKPLK